MKKITIAATGLIAASAIVPNTTIAANQKEKIFTHVATFDVMAGNGSGVAEIVDVTNNGKTIAYTDAENGEIGLVDISNPAHPVGLGAVELGGEPTSLAICDPYILVGINTSEDYDQPSGQLAVIHTLSRKIVTRLELGGQPDSLALSPDQKYAAIVIENERDEDLDGGLIPQNQTGELLILKLRGAPKHWKLSKANLSPVAAAAYAGSDLEPEFVDINAENEAVVSFQENNHLAIVDLTTGQTINQFSAGEVELHNVDTEEEDLINFDSTIVKRAEPDAVAWIDHDSFATANEGDYEDENGIGGGSRGFTIFNQDGTVEYESAESFEHWLASAGHFNEGRSENKGCEPEAVEVGTYGKKTKFNPRWHCYRWLFRYLFGPNYVEHIENLLDTRRTFLFVGSERCNAVGVYTMKSGQPEATQLLPTGIGPEGLKAIPKRNLFIASTEKEEAEDGIPTMLNIYHLSNKPASYPMIQSTNDENETPIPWVALSGLVADPENENMLYGVSDSFLGAGFIYAIDVADEPALIHNRMEVTGASHSLDLEGITIGPDGTFWLASEGNAKDRPNLILQVDGTTGTVISEIELPSELEAFARKNGFEGIAVTGEAGAEMIYVAIQRAWPDAGDTDKLHTKIGRYNSTTEEWGFVYYPLEAEGNGGWIGLSELTALPNGKFAVIERDKGWGPSTGNNAELKAIYSIDLTQANFQPLGSELATLEKYLTKDVLPVLASNSIWTAEKLEGLAVTVSGKIYVVTDNDGLDSATGETVFLRLK